MEELKLTHVYDRQPGQVHIRLERNSKGYNWEVSFANEDSEVALSKIREVNAGVMKIRHFGKNFPKKAAFHFEFQPMTLSEYFTNI